jgi:phosphoribosyl-dephospho-CoA transferase
MSLHAPQSDLLLQRHRLVRVRPAAWSAWLASRSDLANEALLPGWVDRGWPLIVRRPAPGDSDGLPLGLPLPPSAGKRRIAIQMVADDIVATTPLPPLAECADAAPAAWQPSLRELATHARAYGVEARVFGSLAWQRLTGLTYLSPGSDLDIVWTLPDRNRISWFLSDLADIDSRAPVRIDGELLRADGAGVNWRELHSGAPELVVKRAADVILCRRESFIGIPS